MNILNNLTFQNLKLNKKRTIMTIAGIVLSTALICAVSGMLTSARKTLIEGTKLSSGNYHAVVYNVANKDLSRIRDNRQVEDFFLYENLGYQEETTIPGYQYSNVTGVSVSFFESNKIKVTGKLPSNSSEIVVLKSDMENFEKKYKIGDEIDFKLHDRVYGKDVLDQNSPYTDGEKLVYKYSKKYKLVGIIDDLPSIVKGYIRPGVSFITVLDNTEKTSIALLYKEPKDCGDITKKLANDYGYSVNSELLRWVNVGSNNYENNFLIVTGLIVIGIIVATSIFVIRNSFSISITEKTRQYGMLASIGATPKQIRKNVLFEGFILGLIAIPLGVIFGILAVVILIAVLNFILVDVLNDFATIYDVPYIAIIATIVISSLTIFLSTITSAYKASKITPLEAIRNSNEIKMNNKKIKAPKFIKKIFKVGGDIAYKNLKRSKKQYRTTIISLIVSIVAFISLNSFIEYGFNMGAHYFKSQDFNITIYDNSEEKLSNYNRIKNLKNIDRYAIYQTKNIELKKDVLSDFGKSIKDIRPHIAIISIGDQEYRRYLKELDLSYSDDHVILIDEIIKYDNTKKTFGNATTLDKKDTVLIPDDVKQEGLKITFKTNKKPIGFDFEITNTVTIVISDKKMMEITPEYASYMYIKTSNHKDFVKELEDLKKNSSDFKQMSVSDLEEYAKTNNALVLVISIFLYGFIAVITLIGVTNIFNTITTNMNLRSREFAMLKAIGMSDKEFKRMINLESVFYGLKSLLFGIPIGLILSYTIYKVIASEFDIGYMIPIIPIIISIIFVFIIISITMRYSLKKINSQNIIETIRNDNI